MLAFETLHGTRVVASPSTLDTVDWPASAIALRFAPDDVFVIGAETIGVSGAHVIVTDDAGYSGAWLDAEELTHVMRHVEWPLPTERPVLVQGLVASVPAKLYLAAVTAAPTMTLTSAVGGSVAAAVASGVRVAMLLTNTPYVAELQERLR